MKHGFNFSLAIFFLFISYLTVAQGNIQQEITIDELHAHLGYLASDDLKGRKPGTEEGFLAAQYINLQFRQANLIPLGDDGFQYFKVATSISLGENNELIVGDMLVKPEEGYMPFAYSKNDEVSGHVVFTGYGFEIDTDTLKWDDYGNIDVKGKWVMILRGDPEPDNTNSNYINFSGDRGKVLTARDKGAAGILFVSGKNWDEKDQLVSLYYDKSISSAGLPVLQIKRDIADRILEGTEKTIDELEKRLNEQKNPASFNIEIQVKVKTQIFHDWVRTQNVVFMLMGSDPVLKDQYIVVGGHYDHLGMGGQGSGSRKPDTIAVHYGADDNASGVTGLIEIAEKLSFNRDSMQRSIVFIAFGAEEMGLLGSKYFLDNPLVKKDRIIAMINFDMIGRLNEDKVLIIGGSGTSIESEDIINKAASSYSLDLRLSPEGYGPSDHAPFYANDIPVFFINTGAHEDYHTPEDDIDKINFEGQKLVSDFAYDLITELANRDSTLTYQEAGSGNRGRRVSKFKVTLGIMPDFSVTDVDGLGVGGVRKDGPAYSGGMKKGDLIIALDGKPVNNIYDYMNRLKKLEPGQIITVDVIRDDEIKVLLIQL